MITRRNLALGAAVVLASVGRSRAGAPVLTEDGFYREPWFIDSFLDLAEDIEAARSHGRRLAVIWELKGCPYCRETHLVNFARPDIGEFVRENFDVLQLNIIGARKVTDVDGRELGEKAFAAKYAVRFTPTIQFFPESAEGLGEKAAGEREVARMAGYYRPDDFLAMFRYVREKAYEARTFREYLGAGRS